MSIVERLGGFSWRKGTTFILVVQEFGEKSDDLTGIFNSCWVFGCAKCGIYEVGLHDMGYFLTFAADYRRNCSGKAAKNVKLL